VAWFLEALKKATMNLYESTITMLESAVLNMEEAQSKLSAQQVFHLKTAVS
jgi:hypothetical protein